MLNEEIVKDLNRYAKILMKNRNVTDYDLKIEGKSDVGDNYNGEIIFFKIIAKTEENEEKIYNLVMKTAQRSEILREKMKVDTYIDTELIMYSKVFTEFTKFCKEMNPNFSFDIIPNTYLIVNELKKETIILENLISAGYKLHDRKKPWNLKHSLFAMQNFGKFHGISLALQEKWPESFTELCNSFPETPTELPDFNFDKYYDECFKKVMTYLKEVQREDLVDKYSGYVETGKPIMRGIIEDQDKSVICHIDCWNNNFMFKYEDKEEATPTKMCFLDFQASGNLSPVFDLSCNIYTTCDKENLDNFDLLLKVYYESLINTMESLGCLKTPFTFDDLMNQWKKYGIFGLQRTIAILKVALVNKENVPDLAKLLEEGKGLKDATNIKLLDIEEYKRRVLNVFIHFGEKFL